MAKFTKFGWNQYGELVYRNTGRAAPETYKVRGNTVYGNDGRKIGQIGKGTVRQQQIIRKAATAGGRSKISIPGKTRFKFDHIRAARERAKKAGGLKLTTPKPSADQIDKFGKAVKRMANYSIITDPAIERKIQAMDNKKIMELYNDNEMIFDVYFDYGGIRDKGKGPQGNRETAANAQALIDVYEARYGPILIQSTL